MTRLHVLPLPAYMAYRAGQQRSMRIAHMHLARIYHGEARSMAVRNARAANREYLAYLRSASV